jgi:endonuclease/exonuclease/phosphatase family metal-dependent hydrolase
MREAFRHLTGSYAKTFPSNRPLLCMDRLYYRGIELLESDCLDRRPWNELSDHLPLYARFQLQPG